MAMRCSYCRLNEAEIMSCFAFSNTFSLSPFSFFLFFLLLFFFLFIPSFVFYHYFHSLGVSLSLILFDYNIENIKLQIIITVREGCMRVVVYGRPDVSNVHSDVGVCRSPTRRVGDVCQLVSRGIMVGT